MTEKHVHDCTGPDARCPCGYVFLVPPISLSIDVFDGKRELINETFSCNSLGPVIDALREAADKLEALP